MVIRISVRGSFLRWFGGRVRGRIWNIALEALVLNDEDRSDDEDCAANKDDHHPAWIV